MKLADIELPKLNLSGVPRETLENWLPVVVVAILAWFAARCLKKMFWMAFGLFWAFGGMHSLSHWLH